MFSRLPSTPVEPSEKPFKHAVQPLAQCQSSSPPGQRRHSRGFDNLFASEGPYAREIGESAYHTPLRYIVKQKPLGMPYWYRFVTSSDPYAPFALTSPTHSRHQPHLSPPPNSQQACEPRSTPAPAAHCRANPSLVKSQ